ncbi:MAG: N-acetyl-gamma-glutamyl-phosphate reductase [Candidatus Omnitrophota bacterium]
MIKVGIIGVTGYTGEELLKILLYHPEVEICYLAAKIDKDTPINDIFPWIRKKQDLKCRCSALLREIPDDLDFVFLALPHRVSMEFVPQFLTQKKKVIDLSADYRIKDIKIYEKWYAAVHKDQDNVEKSVYGLPELNFSEIKTARLVANPGCYPTAAIISLAPVLKYNLVAGKVIIDAKSGATGAGRTALPSLLFSEVNEDLKAYKINMHQHMPEIIQELTNVKGDKIEIVFVPHLVAMNRGILCTVYFDLEQEISFEKLHKLYQNFYHNRTFVRIYEKGQNPQVKNIIRSNFCDIGINVHNRSVVLVSVIDNLVKGAAGQAVQNMNIMAGLPEELGLL